MPIVPSWIAGFGAENSCPLCLSISFQDYTLILCPEDFDPVTRIILHGQDGPEQGSQRSGGNNNPAHQKVLAKTATAK